MKLHDLQQRAGTAMVWPPQWVESSEPGHPSAVAGDGVMEGLQRLGNRLLLQITITGRRRPASMEWDPPPAVGDVEVVLLASIGAEIRRLGDLEVPTGTRGLGDEPSSRLVASGRRDCAGRRHAPGQVHSKTAARTHAAAQG